MGYDQKWKGLEPMTQDELRRKCEDEAREILKCKVCEGHGWNIGIALGRNGEPEQTQVQCDKCYRGEIASYGDDLIKAITEALLKKELEAREWKEKYKTLNKELMCELRDPNGTIWEHAKSLQEKLRVARRALKLVLECHCVDVASRALKQIGEEE